MVDCIAATRLLSVRFDRTLRQRERRRLDAHLAVCPDCERCASQLRWLRRLARAWRR